MILTVRTDRPEAETGLFDNDKKIDYKTWQADRELSRTILTTIETLLTENDQKLSDLSGIVVFKGPGSFTGLRIGHAVANALAYGLDVPIVSSASDSWIQDGVKRLLSGENEKIALPDYGADANTTKPRK